MPAGTEHGGITELDCDVSAEEVWEAMRTLKNGKAGCPTDGLVNVRWHDPRQRDASTS
jgi:hypothetical protein